MNRYIKYKIPIPAIYEIIKAKHYKNIIFYIDLQSICSGLYNKNNIFFEINHYIENKTISNSFLTEYRDFLNTLYTKFKFLNPFFITFYDDSKNEQNASLSSSYKFGRTSVKDIIYDDAQLNLHYEIKKYYFSSIEEKFTKEHFGKVFFLHKYESDFIPWFCLSENLYNSCDPNTLNIILSVDKDLLQCCQFNNVIQCTNKFFPSRDKNKFEITLYDDLNAVDYIHKDSGLTSKYIPLILTIGGDSSDKIEGLKGYKYTKAIKLIKSYNLPHKISDIRQLKIIPDDITNNFKYLETCYKMISFEEQVKRVNKGLILQEKINIDNIVNCIDMED